MAVKIAFLLMGVAIGFLMRGFANSLKRAGVQDAVNAEFLASRSASETAAFRDELARRLDTRAGGE